MWRELEHATCVTGEWCIAGATTFCSDFIVQDRFWLKCRVRACPRRVPGVSLPCPAVSKKQAVSRRVQPCPGVSPCPRVSDTATATPGTCPCFIALQPYGSQEWRVLRKLVSVDMLANKKLNETAFVRRKCMDDMLSWIEEETDHQRGGIEIAEFVFLMAFNLMGNLVLSRDMVDCKSRQRSEFVKALFGLMEMSEKIEVIDFFPWLNWLNKLGWRKKMERRVGEALKIASTFVEERIEEKKKKDLMGNYKGKDFLDVLIDFEGNGKDEPLKIPQHNLNVLMLEMHMALAENVGLITEWAMTELIRNPEAMKKAKSELNSIIGLNNKVEESEIDNLPYLQAIIKETLRLHTPVPLLVPKKARNDVKFMGYDIPKNTQVFVNVWAIGRDPEVWGGDPLCFKPERFLRSSVDFKGQHYELLPFGAGRRICVGLSLANRVVHHCLASLVHHFDWEFGANLSVDAMDMRERSGITMRKLKPLLVVPKKKSY